MLIFEYHLSVNYKTFIFFKVENHIYLKYFYIACQRVTIFKLLKMVILCRNEELKAQAIIRKIAEKDKHLEELKNGHPLK